MDIKNLEFKNRFKDKLLNGEKRITLRPYTNLKKGDVVYIHCGGKIIGIAEIRNVIEKSLKDIDDEIAKLDGFKNKNELIEELKRLYGNLPEKIYVIEFSLKSKMEKDPYEVHYENVDLIEIAKKALDHLELKEEDKKILELFLRLRSVRRVAFKLGGLKKRGIVREVLRKSYKRLKQNNLI